MANLASALKGLKEPAKASKKVDLGKAGSFKIHPGKLHSALHIPQDQKIPVSKLEPKRSDSSELKHEKASAKGFRAMKH
jgi:hypothetical protein